MACACDFIEGLNNKIKVIKRRCYGIFKTESLFRRITLDLDRYSIFTNNHTVMQY
ncbi:MAG: transposase [bacterium]|nr:transposase [bacterium]